jgi:hypothetical protein
MVSARRIRRAEADLCRSVPAPTNTASVLSERLLFRAILIEASHASVVCIFLIRSVQRSLSVVLTAGASATGGREFPEGVQFRLEQGPIQFRYSFFEGKRHQKGNNRGSLCFAEL